MTTILQQLPATGKIAVNVQVTADMNVSAFSARKQVNSFVHEQISYMMHADEPTLVVDKQILWRVPVMLSLTSRGVVGEVGTVDVDVQTGQMLLTPKKIEEIEARAESLALHPPSTTGA